MAKRVRVQVRGRVQGVGYRASTRQKADILGLSGWVRNLPEGNVELEAIGKEAAIEALLEWCAKGPQLARVDAVIVLENEDWKGPDRDPSFEIRR